MRVILLGSVLALSLLAAPAFGQDAKLREEIAILRAEKQALEEKVRKLSEQLAKAQAVESELTKLRSEIARGFNDMSERIARLEGSPTRVATGATTTPRTTTTPTLNPTTTPNTTAVGPARTTTTPTILPTPNRTDAPSTTIARSELPRIPDPVIPTGPIRTRPKTDRPKGTPTTVAMVDMVYVWSSLREKQAIEDGLGDLVYAVQFADQGWQKKIREAELDFALLAEGSEAWIEKRRQIESAYIERNVAIASAKTKLNRRRGELTKLLYAKMVDGIGRVADENGYDAVIFKEPEPTFTKIASINELFNERMVVLGTDSVDLSEQVIQVLNREYTKISSAGN